MRINEIENSDILYHGDNYKTVTLTPDLMIHKKSRNQEGVGIYFAEDKSVAETYGKFISSVNKNDLKKIVDSSKLTKEIINRNNAIEFMNYLHEKDEDFWYIISDYSYVTEREYVNKRNISEMYDIMKEQTIKNWQIELAMNVEDINYFVEGWMKYIKIDALVNYENNFYAVINKNIKVTPVNF